jgi:hypothetical protein
VPGDGSDIVINYGAGTIRLHPSIFCINRMVTHNKYEQQRILGDIGIPSSLNRDDFDSDTQVIIKPFSSMGGHGIYDDDSNGIDDRQYYQMKFNKVREFRCHVFSWLSEQVPLIQEKTIEDTSQLCWNKKQGGRFTYPYQPAMGRNKLSRENPALCANLINTAITAVNRLGMDMGGVDLGVDVDGNVKVFEVNSRMGLREQSLASYKAAFWALRTIEL